MIALTVENCFSILSSGHPAKSPEPDGEQKIQPSCDILPSRLGQVKLPFKATLKTFFLNRSFK